MRTPVQSSKFFFFAVLLMIVQLPAVFAQNEGGPASKIYKSRQLGDTAFNENSIDQAISFYKRFKEEAGSDQSAMNDAYEALVSAYTKGGYFDKAEKEIAEYLKKFPNAEKAKIDLYKADILLLQSKHGEALKLYEDILRKIDENNKIYSHVLYGLGLTYIQLKDWLAAENTFTKLQEFASAKNLKWEIPALREKIYAMIMAGKFTEASKQLSNLHKAQENPDGVDPKILKVLLLVKEDKLSEIKAIYDEMIKDVDDNPNSLLYITDILIAKAFLSKNNPESALPYLKDAFRFSPLPADRQQVLRMLINTNVSADNKEGAISSAKLYFEYYGDSEDINNIKLQTAKLLYETAKVKDSLEILYGIVDNSSNPMSVRVEACKQSANILIDEKKFAEAQERLDFIGRNSTDDYTKGEGIFLSAKLLFNQTKFKEATEAFIALSEKNQNWREKALYWAMRSLFEDKNYSKSLEICEKLIGEASGEIKKECLYFHAMILQKQGNFEKAMKEFSSFTKNNANSPFAPLALFECGKMSFDKKDFAAAVKYFSDFLVGYPNNTLAANVIYKRLFANYFQANDEAAITDAKLLAERYPKSQFTVAAVFWLSDYYRDRRIYDKADIVLGDIIAKYKDDEDTVSQALYDRAYICYKINAEERALSYLHELYEKYPNNKIVSEGYFLSGDILSAKANFADALIFYRKAAERRPDSSLENACLGRMGDCYFSMYSPSQDKKNLEEAVTLYTRLLESKNVPTDIFNQTLYKLGKTYELLGNETAALERYNELIYGYVIEENNLKPVWNVKAAHAAVSIYMKRNTPEAARNAINIYKKLIDMKINLGEDYRKIIEDLKKKYKI